jgi:hypothetical protein
LISVTRAATGAAAITNALSSARVTIFHCMIAPPHDESAGRAGTVSPREV